MAVHHSLNLAAFRRAVRRLRGGLQFVWAVKKRDKVMMMMTPSSQ